MPTVVDRFLAEHVEYHGLTDDRRALVVRQLAALEAFAQRPPEQADDQDLQKYLAAQLASGLHVNTVRKHNRAIKPFFRWAWRVGEIDADRYMRIKEVRDPRGSTGQALPRPYALKDIARFWDELDARFPLAPDERLRRFGDGRAKYRRVWRHAMNLQIQAIVGLALFAGLRRAEILNITIDDMHPDNDFVVVHGKGAVGHGSGFREVPFTEEGREYVGEWLRFRARLRPKHDDPWLVLSPNASPKSNLPSSPATAIRETSFNGLLTRVGPGWEAHRFRHTAGTEWLRSGMKLEKVSKLLGHASIEQTLGYAELVREDVARDMRRSEQEFQRRVGRRNRNPQGRLAA